VKPAVCLRCDWEGETRATRCPRCSTVLFRPAEREDRQQVHDAGDKWIQVRPGRRGSEAPPSAPSPAGPGYEPVRRSNPAAVIALVTAILVVGTAVFFRAFTESPVPADRANPTWSASGELVFVASDGADRARLWRWDLETGDAELGPIVDRPVELVSASVVTGSVGVTSITPGGELGASLVRFPASAYDPEPLISGDLVAWATDGSRVVAVRNGEPQTGCHAESGARITSFDLPTQASVVDLRVCADVTSIARAGITTFFTRRSPRGTWIRYVGIHRSHDVLAGYTLLAASPTGDLVVAAGPKSGGAAHLYWQGNTAGPVPYGSGANLLFVDRVLAWSPDAGHALVLGRLGFRDAVWSIRAGAGSSTDIRQPELVVDAVGPTWATYAADGTAYIESNGELVTFRDERVQRVQMPPSVPTPYGPLVWLP
jgi:ribosomal protein L40E